MRIQKKWSRVDKWAPHKLWSTPPFLKFWSRGTKKTGIECPATVEEIRRAWSQEMQVAGRRAKKEAVHKGVNYCCKLSKRRVRLRNDHFVSNMVPQGTLTRLLSVTWKHQKSIIMGQEVKVAWESRNRECGQIWEVWLWSDGKWNETV